MWAEIFGCPLADLFFLPENVEGDWDLLENATNPRITEIIEKPNH